MKHSIRLVILLLVAIAVVSGCHRAKVPGLVQYQGVVTYNGSPLAEGHINFVPIGEGRTAYATTDDSGRFKVTTIDPGDGLVKGKYKVNISKYVVTSYITHSDGGKEPVATNALPAKYASDATPLEIDVTKKDINVKFELTD
jgi:hypothetical protein